MSGGQLYAKSIQRRKTRRSYLRFAISARTLARTLVVILNRVQETIGRRLRRCADICRGDSLKAVADRWACDRSTVRRNLEAAGVKAFCLGHGKHGIVRYLLRDIEDYERRCREP